MESYIKVVSNQEDFKYYFWYRLINCLIFNKQNILFCVKDATALYKIKECIYNCHSNNSVTDDYFQLNLLNFIKEKNIKMNFNKFVPCLSFNFNNGSELEFLHTDFRGRKYHKIFVAKDVEDINPLLSSLCQKHRDGENEYRKSVYYTLEDYISKTNNEKEFKE